MADHLTTEARARVMAVMVEQGRAVVALEWVRLDKTAVETLEATEAMASNPRLPVLPFSELLAVQVEVLQHLVLVAMVVVEMQAAAVIPGRMVQKAAAVGRVALMPTAAMEVLAAQFCVSRRLIIRALQLEALL